MPQPQTRQELIDYAKRQLGEPVIEVNVADVQIEDILDDVIQMLHNEHLNLSERVFLRHEITQNDLDNNYITIDDSIISVSRIYPLSNHSGNLNLFDAKQRMLLNDLYSLEPTQMTHWHITKMHLSLIEDQLNPAMAIEFNRHTNKINFRDTLENVAVVGEFLLFDVYKTLDPNTYTKIYNNEFLKKYFTQHVKKQWGTNLKKYQGMQLPGGVEFNGQEIYREAVEELEKLKEELESKFREPPLGFIG